MSQSRSSFADFAAQNSPFSQFAVENILNANSNNAYHSFLSASSQGLRTTATTTAYRQPFAVANAFPLQLPIITPSADVISFKLNPPELSLPIFTSDLQINNNSSNACNNFMAKSQNESTLKQPSSLLQAASNTAIRQFGLRALDSVIEGSRGYLGTKIRLAGLVTDVYDRTQSDDLSDLDPASLFVIASLAGISKSVTATVGYGTVVTEGVLMAGASGGAGLIPATIFVSAALPAVDTLSNIVGDSVELACLQIVKMLKNYVDATHTVQSPSSIQSSNTEEQEKLFRITLDIIKKSDPRDLSVRDCITVTKRVEAVNSLKATVQSMQRNGLKTSDAEAGDLMHEISVIESKMNSVVRECVLNRDHRSGVSNNPSALFSTANTPPMAATNIIPSNVILN